jgi:hypothetical protein
MATTMKPTNPKLRKSWTEVGAIAIDGNHGKAGMYIRLMRTEGGEGQIRVCHMWRKDRGPLREGKPCAFFTLKQAMALDSALIDALATATEEALQ